MWKHKKIFYIYSCYLVSQAKSWCTKKNTVKAILITIVTICVIYLYNLWGYHVDSKGDCEVHPRMEHFMVSSWVRLKSTLNTSWRVHGWGWSPPWIEHFVVGSSVRVKSTPGWGTLWWAHGWGWSPTPNGALCSEFMGEGEVYPRTENFVVCSWVRVKFTPEWNTSWWVHQQGEVYVKYSQDGPLHSEFVNEGEIHSRMEHLTVRW